MGVVVPTVDEIHQMLQAALGRLGHRKDGVIDEYNRRFRSVLDPHWTDLGEGVSVLVIDNLPSLFRVDFKQFIYDHEDSQKVKIASTVEKIAGIIRGAVPAGRSVDFEFEFPNDKKIPFGVEVARFARGVVRS